MKLTAEGLTDRKEWEEKGYHLPQYDREAMIRKTREHPEWVHFGAGNIFRAFHANLAQKLLEQGDAETGITVCEGFDYEIIGKQYRPHDNLSVLVTLKADGSIDKSVIGAVGESTILDSENAAEFERLKEIFSADSLRLCTFTVTEKGYNLVNGRGEMLPAVSVDFAAGPERPQSYIGKVASLLYTRYLAGEKPVAMVSTDNCSRNGEKLYQAVMAFAKAWTENGTVDAGFTAYLDDRTKVSFPWSMIDKITPRPDASVESILQKDGLEGLEPVVTTKKTWVAPFVNSEETEYLVIEDWFPNGRPALEKAGVIFTDRDTVGKVERMKVTTCLNPLHTALAVYGCLLGYTRISAEMRDPDLSGMVKILGYREGLPVVVNPGVLDPKAFLDTVVNVRIPNPFMPDTPQRIATDTSQKLAIRYGETIRSYMASNTLDVQSLSMVPLVLAGWIRYLCGVDDEGKAFELSPDPLLSELTPRVKGLYPNVAPDLTVIDPLLHDASIFGVDLFEAGLADKVKMYLAAELQGPGAVRRTVHEAVERADLS